MSSYPGFGKASGPSAPADKSVFPPSSSSIPQPPLTFSTSTLYRSHSNGSHFTVNKRNHLVWQRTESPPSLENTSVESHRKSFGEAQRSDFLFDDSNHLGQQILKSPPVASGNQRYVDLDDFADAQRPGLSSSRQRLSNYSNSLALEDFPPVSTFLGSHDSGRSFPTEIADGDSPETNRFLPSPSANGVLWDTSHTQRNDFKRQPYVSPLRSSTRSNILVSTYVSPIGQRAFPSSNIGAEATEIKPTNVSVPKRTRSPPLPYADQGLHGNFYTSQDDTEREMQAKAKRLARFKVELSETSPSGSDFADRRVPANRHEQPTVGRGNSVGRRSIESAGQPTNEKSLPDEVLDSSSIITGFCPDMCPESERAERERKGDLDQFERVDGNRNQTRKSLAVKKYNRTAEREAYLIRPMPILQKTIDYLLSLLDQPYDEKFLGMYNFLWDRMRAIRMDLRMQHIFNHGAMKMLEQMIRLHIIAMHELCGYAKGEGFSEGFDAHLNIEQMNKTSVELFQLYDDHRKKGINVPTEKEFRGYYALLKLDKHPGYKVEPAELSLDLAKMTPEIRQTPEVLFARDVARACRTGNFIAFFRLARKASYLQACLMHAHFAKLRTQALASLHCGLLSNQGLPVSHVASWLGMEEEDIESLLEYHGFLIKEYEEPYMVKEGSFLNGDKDYPTKCSNLVQVKKSRRILEDVNDTCLVPFPAEVREIQQAAVHMQESKLIPSREKETSIDALDEEMSDFKEHSSLKGVNLQPISETSAIAQQTGDKHEVVRTSSSPWVFSAHNFPVSQPVLVKTVEKPTKTMEKPKFDVLFAAPLERSIHSGVEMSPSASRNVKQDLAPGPQSNYALDSSLHLGGVSDKYKGDTSPNTAKESESTEAIADDDENEEVALAKLKLIIRLWKRRASKQRELREQRQLAANAALSSLSLGPPIRQHKDQLQTLAKFDIDLITRQREEKREKSWSRLNVSDVIAGVLSRRKPDAKCFCWKIVCSDVNSLEGGNLSQNCQFTNMEAGSWLHSKMMPTSKNDDDDLVISSPGLSIWKKWVPRQLGTDLACCLSVIQDTRSDNLNETVSGASAILFLVYERIPLELQKIKLHNIMMSLPSDSCLPLLILCDSYNEDLSDCYTIINKLGLNDIEKSRISSFRILFLLGENEMEHDGFFIDERLREGMQWLASESPLHPALQCVKTRDLVLSHLNPTLDLLDKFSDYDVHPNHCISAFNEALDQSMGKISTSANSNSSCWPCPEISLLEEFSDEHIVTKSYLPCIGWSSVGSTQPILSALIECKLPIFSDDTSWLRRSSNSVKEIEDQRLQLEKCLIRYLAQLIGHDLATKEACVMVQKSARLVLHNSSYYIIPKWVLIFRRIFSWRLMNLSSIPISSAYVLEEHNEPPPPTSGFDKLELENSAPSFCYLDYPPLDEVIVAGCTPLFSCGAQEQPETSQPQVVTTQNKGLTATSAEDLHETDFAENGARLATYIPSTRPELIVSPKLTTEAEKLSNLLQQCNMVQNRIDEKLSIYF